MTVSSKAMTKWYSGLTTGQGKTTLASGNGEFEVDWQARSEGREKATTPEELLAAAHASCYSMALSFALEQNGTPPHWVQVEAEVKFEAGVGVKSSMLTVHAKVSGIDQLEFSRFAEDAKDNCPVSKALAGVDISLESATLEESVV
ncbi:OsmC family peroxiredoxin [Demequina sp. SYSU T00192]|uniref:OsmC family peroxiredoxin n=1 Tax=Demequina litoralis TaxID=3051660 RepID=A0ABT8G673_9MICO|nr:OsmC family peroxiredoxin [Demequina sp. SYSU T00192]MDN4474414.1 OsmC family peroxiredoxin [Demequina sp. SYSU T00192]